MPWWKAKPGNGKHGVDDKAAHKIGKKWDADREEQERQNKENPKK